MALLNLDQPPKNLASLFVGLDLGEDAVQKAASPSSCQCSWKASRSGAGVSAEGAAGAGGELEA
jgi:hypothetical protein